MTDAAVAVHSRRLPSRGRRGQSLTPRLRAISRAVRLSIAASVARIRPVVDRIRGARVLQPRRCRGRRAEPDEKFWREVRSRFLVPKDFAFLNAANLCPMSLPVVEAIEKNMRGYEVNPAPEPRSKLLHAREDARTMLAEALRVTPEEIVLTRNTTEGNNFVSSGLTLGAGDEVIVSTDNHPSNLNAWRQKATRFGFTVVAVPPPPAHPGHRRIRRAVRESVHAADESAGDQLREQQLGRHASRRGACASWRASAACSRSSTARRRSACST